MRRNEVPTPKHFTAHIVFKTSLSPTELLPHWQDMGELNPILHIDSVICKTITLHILLVLGRRFELLSSD